MCRSVFTHVFVFLCVNTYVVVYVSAFVGVGGTVLVWIQFICVSVRKYKHDSPNKYA